MACQGRNLGGNISCFLLACPAFGQLCPPFLRSVKSHSNIDVGDGLVNGATGVVVGFILSNDYVHKVLVKFDDERVGHLAQQHSPYSIEYPSAVPIQRVEVVFFYFILLAELSHKTFAKQCDTDGNLHGLSTPQILCSCM